MVLGTSLIDTRWHIKLKIGSLLTRKIKVGFGPITTGEDDLAERKWRIDPIINKINEMDTNYSAGFFIEPHEMKNFDILVIVKKFNPDFVPIISKLKALNKLFIYDIVDNPNSEDKYRFYFGDHPDFSRQMDGFILSSPLHEPIAKRFSSRCALIEHPIIHHLYKQEYQESREINILAHGYYANLINLKNIEPIIQKVSKKVGKKLCLTYHSEEVFSNTEWVKYVKWTIKNSFTEMIAADIAVTIKNLNELHQKTKPSTKVISFMAAGLPVICTPTDADRLVIEHGVTGLFAFNRDDWEKSLTELALDVKRREQIGKAARKSVLDKYSIDLITNKYITLLDTIITHSHNKIS